MRAPESGVQGRFKSWWTAAGEAFGAAALPGECPICGAEPEAADAPFCIDCRFELLAAAGAACPRCAMPVGPWGVRAEGCGDCLKRPLGFDSAFALGPYQGPIRDLCLRLKHESNAWVAPWLAGVLVEARPALCVLASAGAVIVPVPLHWRRQWKRGYNQSEELARGLAERLDLPALHLLRRVKATAKSAGLGRVERARSLRNAFRVRVLRRGALRGRTVILVDDVLTTGATCGWAARALKQGGARRVVAVVVARA